jgi:hypothetical protein
MNEADAEGKVVSGYPSAFVDGFKYDPFFYKFFADSS